MDINEIQRISHARSLRWGTQGWILVDWTNAMCGESGEAANIAKKLRRLDFQLPNKQAGLDVKDSFNLRLKCAQECADTILYALLTMDYLGFNAYETLAEVFNKKSEEYGFPERI